jgi:hypothetical protein
MGRRLLVVAALAAAVACADKKKSEGLPPAPEWGVDPSGGMAKPPSITAAGSAHRFHGSDEPDVTELGLPPPDPNRLVDPTHHVTGVIRIHPKARSRAKASTPVFVIVKHAGADGAASGPPLAVAKLTWGDKTEIPFELTEDNAMIGGTQLTGDVIVVARYDQDSDALTKESGDISGETHVSVPADHVVLTLDTVIP